MIQRALAFSDYIFFPCKEFFGKLLCHSCGHNDFYAEKKGSTYVFRVCHLLLLGFFFVNPYVNL